MPLDFIPRYHFKNAAGQWQFRPVNPRLTGQVVDEALRLCSAGEPMAPIIDADPAPRSSFSAKLKE